MTTSRTALSQTVVRKDRELELKAQSSSEELAKHRWHWTLDESNPDRVSFGQYAREVGRSKELIRIYARGWEAFKKDHGSVVISEAISRARLGVETETAVGAVASARGISFERARQAYYDEARQIRDIARERAELNGTSTIEEIPNVAAEWDFGPKQKKGSGSPSTEVDRDEEIQKALVKVVFAVNDKNNGLWEPNATTQAYLHFCLQAMLGEAPDITASTSEQLMDEITEYLKEVST